MKTRHDGSHYADSEQDSRALADSSDPGVSLGESLPCDLSLGDLIVQALVGRDLVEGVTGNHEDYESFEHALLERVALEIRAVNHAMATDLTTDDRDADCFSAEHACAYLRGLARRVEAGAELAKRLRDARWGHPCFGGGESYLVAQAEKLRSTSPLHEHDATQEGVS